MMEAQGLVIVTMSVLSPSSSSLTQSQTDAHEISLIEKCCCSYYNIYSIVLKYVILIFKCINIKYY